jgi:hypothetical protein
VRQAFKLNDQALVAELSLERVLKRFSKEAYSLGYGLIYVLSLMPAGLFESDL